MKIKTRNAFWVRPEIKSEKIVKFTLKFTSKFYVKWMNILIWQKQESSELLSINCTGADKKTGKSLSNVKKLQKNHVDFSLTKFLNNLSFLFFSADFLHIFTV